MIVPQPGQIAVPIAAPAFAPAQPPNSAPANVFPHPSGSFPSGSTYITGLFRQ